MIFAIFFALSVLPSQADALLQPKDAIRDYVRSTVPRGKKLSAYERELLLALGNMDADVAAQAQPVTRVSSATQQQGADSKINKSYSMHPLTFGIPSKHVQDAVQPKGRALSTVVPGDWSTYAYMPREDQTPQQRAQLERDYYIDMQRSFFGLTWKKGGWDCLRHIELLASGCLPLFTDIARAPRGVLSLYPKRVLELLLDFPGGANLTGVPGQQGTPTSTDPSFDPKDRVVVIDQEKINLPVYATAVNVLLEFTRDRLTTEAVAAHVYFLSPLAAAEGAPPKKSPSAGEAPAGAPERTAAPPRRVSRNPARRARADPAPASPSCPRPRPPRPAPAASEQQAAESTRRASRGTFLHFRWTTKKSSSRQTTLRNKACKCRPGGGGARGQRPRRATRGERGLAAPAAGRGCEEGVSVSVLSPLLLLSSLLLLSREK